ncbi:Protein of unknown function [Pyronema omphalodes CBS 100304]|uniref:Uncharacterized protein n=1 Tax=Pyronema omphalodes (strain CBS 100304) TaxID=1076935 RepID=U4L703_PYROM|nr:Protein of unknown function [Pyronema omphalodes CBS 100304]
MMHGGLLNIQPR